MKKQKKKGLIVTERDHRLFEFLFRGRIATVEQVNEYIFGGISFQGVGRRLSRLCDNGFILKSSFILGQKTKMSYQVTDKGLGEIQSSLPYKVTARSRKSDSPEHDMTLNDIRLRLGAAQKVLRILSENELQSCAEFERDSETKAFVALNSDGAIQLQNRDGYLYVALEYDASEKSHHRYVEKIGSYYRHSGVPAVLYICKNNHIRKVLKKAETEVLKGQDKKPKFYYALLSDILGNVDEMAFENLSGRIFKL